ncbi:MAG TPA: hypothetical protein VGR47_03860 [Terracidiphilus sp.]|nr:hypothetical protein [Terracidiphilus sp.]
MTISRLPSYYRSAIYDGVNGFHYAGFRSIDGVDVFLRVFEFGLILELVEAPLEPALVSFHFSFPLHFFCQADCDFGAAGVSFCDLICQRAGDAVASFGHQFIDCFHQPLEAELFFRDWLGCGCGAVVDGMEVCGEVAGPLAGSCFLFSLLRLRRRRFPGAGRPSGSGACAPCCPPGWFCMDCSSFGSFVSEFSGNFGHVFSVSGR